MADVLVVEDIPSNAQMYRVILERAEHVVRTVETKAAAEAALEERVPDAMLLDLQLPDGNGLDLLQDLRSAGTVLPTVVLTGNGSVQRAVDAMQAGAIDFLMKPCSPDKMVEAVGQAVARWTPSAGGEGEDTGKARPDRGPSGFIGESPTMRNVFALIESAAASAAPVFITGESGTGKELCARAIHDGGARRNGAFVPLNCAAIPRELMESEIFGHRKGAFTGAVESREGAAAVADSGTLFLDEICEMDLDLQAKLLRLIQQGTFKRVGDSQEREVDIRFVCATNRDPMAEVRAGRFREDLYYRLHVVPLALPPLRERPGDVRMLAERFLADFATVEGKPFRGFDPDALATLERYPWPGNVRELENVIRSVTVLHSGSSVSRDMLPAHVRSAGESRAASVGTEAPGASGGAAPVSGQGPSGQDLSALLVRPLEELEILAIDTAIEQFGGNVTRAAQALNISTSTIYRKKQAWSRRQGESVRDG
jgi:two-component system repressor protein LuxO